MVELIKKRYTRLVEKYIEKELSAQLKKLTRTEGQILIKLIYCYICKYINYCQVNFNKP